MGGFCARTKKCTQYKKNQIGSVILENQNGSSFMDLYRAAQSKDIRSAPEIR